jgi:hypothetical protein
VAGWPDPRAVSDELVIALNELSGGAVAYEISGWRTLWSGSAVFSSEDAAAGYIDVWSQIEAMKQEVARGEVTLAEYREALVEAADWMSFRDWRQILGQMGLNTPVNAGECEEIWVWRPPLARLPRATMAGAGAYRCLSDPPADPDFGPAFVAMGFDVSEGLPGALHAYAHRAEALLARTLPRIGGGAAWRDFTAYDRKSPGGGGSGTVHCPPDSDLDDPEPEHPDTDHGPAPELDLASALAVDLRPAPGSAPVRSDARDWTGLDARAAHDRWWLAQLARHGSGSDPWWRIVADPDRYK